MCFSFRKSLKICLWNLYLHTRPFWRFLLCGVAHALSIAPHVKFLQVAIEQSDNVLYKLHQNPIKFHSFGEWSFFFFENPPMILFAFVSFIIILFFWRYPALIMGCRCFPALLKNRPQAGRLFVAGNGQVEHASLGLRTWCHVWLAKFKTKKDLCQSIKGYQRCVLATFEIWLFHVSLLSWNKLFKDIGPLNKDGSHHSNLYLPPETRFRIGRGFLTVHPWPAYPPSKWHDSPWDSDQRLVSTGAVPAAICNATQRNDPHLPKSFSSEWKSKPKITWATVAPNWRDPVYLFGSGILKFHGFYENNPPHNGVFFFHPLYQGPFRQDGNAMAAMVETTGGSHGLHQIALVDAASEKYSASGHLGKLIVPGRNPANSPVDMESILHYLQGLYTSKRWENSPDFWTINSSSILTVPEWRHGEMWTNKNPADTLRETET